MMLKMKCFGALAGCALATGSLCAATYSESFEGGTAGQAFASWDGGTVTNNGDYAYSKIAGYPMDANHTKVLLVEGDTSYDASEGSYTGTPLVDMMVQAALPDEELDPPEAGAHIAIAVDTNGIFNVYCKDKSDVAGWHPLSSTVYTDGTWARVSLLFDYVNGLCQIRIDGEPMMTEYGYRDTTKTGNGAWYNLVSTGSAVSNLTVIGCTAIDDVVIAANAENYAMTTGAATNGVSCAWLDANGLSWDTTQSYDSSMKSDGAGGTTAMTVADKYKYCFDPFDGQGEADFAVKSITTSAEKVTLTLPTTVANDGRKVVVDYGTDKTFEDAEKTTTVDVTGTTTVEINIPAPGSVTYYRLRATDRVSE